MKNSPSASTFWQKWRTYIIVGVCVIVFLGLFLSGQKKVPTSTSVQVENVEDTPPLSVESVIFGSWIPGSGQEVLGTVESIGDITLTAELNGTIDQVYVNIGDRVSRGQVLATYRRGDDQTFINYQNAVSQQAQTEATAQNSVAQAEINVQTAQQELREQKALQDQSLTQGFTALITQSDTAEITIAEGLDYADRLTKATDKFRFESNPLSSQVGRNNSVLKQSVKNRVIEQRRSQGALTKNYFDDSSTLYEAEKRYAILVALRGMVNDLDLLIRQTPETNAYTIADRSSLEAQVEQEKAAIVGAITALKNQIEATKGQGNQSSIAIVQAENRLETARANLELAKSNAESSLVSAQNAVNLAGATLTDLDVRAPFDAVITDKLVNQYQQVRPGEILFSLVNTSIAPKVTAFVTKRELSLLQQTEEVNIYIDGTVYAVEKGSMSNSIDPATQKIKVEYTLPLDADVPVGIIARIEVPSVSGDTSILLPLSAIGFEPDGPEVLLIKEGEAKRQKISVGGIQSDGIQVTAGLLTGDQVIRYRNRVYAGQKVSDQNAVSENIEEDLAVEELDQ